MQKYEPTATNVMDRRMHQKKISACDVFRAPVSRFTFHWTTQGEMTHGGDIPNRFMIYDVPRVRALFIK